VGTGEGDPPPQGAVLVRRAQIAAFEDKETLKVGLQGEALLWAAGGTTAEEVNRPPRKWTPTVI
jgi:hypothetical protein